MADNDAVEFLALLRPGGPWVLSAIEPDGKIETITAKTDGDVRAFVSKHNGARNLYYSVNPTRKAMNKKATKTDIAAIEYVLADLDPADGETPEAAKARYLAQLEGRSSPSPPRRRQRQRHPGFVEAAGAHRSRRADQWKVLTRGPGEDRRRRGARRGGDAAARQPRPARRTSTASCACRAPPTCRTRRSARRAACRVPDQAAVVQRRELSA